MTIFCFFSCHSSICRAHSIFRVVFHTNVNSNTYWYRLYCIYCWLPYIYWFYEQYGSLQSWAHSKVALFHLSSTEVPHVHPLVSLSSLSFTLFSIASVPYCWFYLKISTFKWILFNVIQLVKMVDYEIYLFTFHLGLHFVTS